MQSEEKAPRRAFVRLTGAVAAIAITAVALAGGVRLKSSKAKRPGKPVLVIAPTPTPTPTPMPTPSPTPTSSVNFASVELPAVASNFDTSSLLVPSWGTGQIPASASPDVVGAFRFICNASHLAYDDPIVYPGQPGRSHLHQFFGNTAANSYSTYSSLRSSGDSTCANMLNRSAYWMPAMLDGHGGVVVPDYVTIYYKRLPAADPECQRQGIACVKLPRGLRYVFGYNMMNPIETPTGAAWFNCDGPTATQGRYPDIVAAAAKCPVGNRLGAVINAPDCWNGKDLDSPDHRSHVAYATYGDWGYLKCPATHPYVVPTFTMGVWYTTDDNLDRSGFWSGSKATWHLSSDAMAGMAPMRPGSSFHADWFGAWDDSVMEMWTDNCVGKMLNCSGADLGNGKQLRASAGFSWNANPRIVPVPG